MVKLTNGERMAILETKVDNIDKTINKVDKKLDNLCDELPKVYATKKELNDVKNTLLEADKRQDTKNDSKWDWISKNWFQILQMIAILIIGLIASRGGLV